MASASSASTVPCSPITTNSSTTDRAATVMGFGSLSFPVLGDALAGLALGVGDLALDRAQLGARQRFVLDQVQHQRVGLAIEHLADELAEAIAQHRLAAMDG